MCTVRIEDWLFNWLWTGYFFENNMNLLFFLCCACGKSSTHNLMFTHVDKHAYLFLQCMIYGGNYLPNKQDFSKLFFIETNNVILFITDSPHSIHISEVHPHGE